MKHNSRPILREIRPSRSRQLPQITLHTTRQQRRIRSRLGVRPQNRRRRRIARIIQPGIKHIRRESEIIRISLLNQTRRFDQRFVTLGLIEELFCVPFRRGTVGCELLQHDRGGMVVAEAVSVDFVVDLAGAVVVLEAGGIDGAALVEGTGQGLVFGCVRALDGFGGCDADAVLLGVLAGEGGEVHDERSVVLCRISFCFVVLHALSYLTDKSHTLLITSGAQISGLSAIQSGNGPGSASWLSSSFQVLKSGEEATWALIPLLALAVAKA